MLGSIESLFCHASIHKKPQLSPKRLSIVPRPAVKPSVREIEPQMLGLWASKYKVDIRRIRGDKVNMPQPSLVLKSKRAREAS
jgi:hypothetical protein